MVIAVAQLIVDKMKGDIKMRDKGSALLETGTYRPLVGGSNPSAAILNRRRRDGDTGSRDNTLRDTMIEVGYVAGKHFTEYVDTVKALKREGELDEAERLLLRLVEATEAENRVEGYGVAPWYYEQLAIIYRKREDYGKEIAILERYVQQQNSTRNLPSSHSTLLQRLDKAKDLASNKG